MSTFNNHSKKQIKYMEIRQNLINERNKEYNFLKASENIANKIVKKDPELYEGLGNCFTEDELASIYGAQTMAAINGPIKPAPQVIGANGSNFNNATKPKQLATKPTSTNPNGFPRGYALGPYGSLIWVGEHEDPEWDALVHDIETKVETINEPKVDVMEQTRKMFR